jgi:hypothetical protein
MECNFSDMKPSEKALIPFFVASAIMMTCVFRKPLGLPEGAEIPLAAAAAVCLGLGFYLSKKVKKPSDEPPPLPSVQKKKWILIAASLTAACIAGPFILPLSGPNLPFHVWVGISAFTFVFSMAILLIGMKMKSR